MDERMTFTDHGGVRWTVYSVPARRVEHNDEVIEQTPPHLCIEAQVGSTVLLRRIDEYPADWPAMEPAELVRLSTLEGPVEAALHNEETPQTQLGIAALET